MEQSKTLFSIGEMAKLFDVNIRTLRYYDQIGLLKPESVNAETGYRYYSPAQFERLNTIKYLRALDVPIASIARFFDNRDIGLLRDIFEDQLSEVRAKYDELARIQRKIERRIALIDDVTATPLDCIQIKQVERRPLVRLSQSFGAADDLEPLIRDLSRRASLHDAIFLGKIAVSISLDDLEAGNFDRRSSVLLFLEEEDRYGGSEEFIAAGTFATLRHRGTHRDSAPHYRRLMEFIAENGWRVCGNSVETTIVDSGMTADESQHVTELQIPIERC